MKKTDVKTLADRYAKIVEWSAEDACYIGRVPALGYGGVHGKDRARVFEEICRVAEEMVKIPVEPGSEPARVGARQIKRCWIFWRFRRHPDGRRLSRHLMPKESVERREIFGE